jgi:type VI secretion system protein VasJ
VEACLGTAWAPQASARERLANLASGANHLALLEESENALARSPLWLDAHRYSAEALEALGSDHAAARDVVIGHLRSLLTRFPDLPGLRFKTGMAVAETATQAWLQNRAGGAPAASGPNLDHAALRAFSAAERLAARGDAEGGLQLLARGLRAAWGKRDRMLWNVALVRFLLTLARHDLAEALMKEIDDAAKSVSDDWEPQCVALIQETKLELLRSKPQKSSSHDKDLSDIVTTLARLDPGRAFRLVQ